MSDLAVPKRRVDVVLRLVGGLERRVTLFLAETSPLRAGGERVTDLLEGDGEFVPALEAGGMTFVRRSAILVAAAPPEAATGAADEVTLPTEHEVEVTLDDGAVLRGLVSYVLPPERSRLIDHLNDRARFLPLRAGDAVHLVHKQHVVRVAAVGR